MNLGHYKSEKQTVSFENDRPFSGTWLIGKKGTGKTTALVNYILEDIEEGRQAIFIDLNGRATDAILSRVPEHRAEAITVLDFAEAPPVMNLFYDIPREQHPFVAGALVNIARAIWDYGSQPTPRLDLYLRASARLALSPRHGTLLDLYHLLTDKTFRDECLRREEDEIVKDMWQRFGEKDSREQSTNIESALTRIFEIVSDPLVRGIVGRYRTSFDLKDTTVLLATIPESIFGGDIARMFGCLLLALVQLSGEPFHLYLDNADRFAPAQVIDLLDSPVALTVAHRYLDQLSPELRATLLGTAGPLVTFQIGPRDAEAIQPMLEAHRKPSLGYNEVNSVYHLTEIPPLTAYARTHRTEHITIPMLPDPTDPKIAKAIRDRCRSQHGLRNESTSTG
jgi:hypothetical protein